MSFLNQMGAAVGIGAATVSVAIPQGAYHWGDTIQGTVVVTGGTADQAGDLRVSILEHWETRDDDGTEHHYRHHNEAVLLTGVEAPAGSTRQYDFQVLVPQGADFGSDWYACVRLGVPRAVDREGRAGFTMLPPASASGLGVALCSVLPFRQIGRGSNSSTAEVSLDFAPPDTHKQYLDGVKLVVREAGGQLTGYVEVNPQEKSFADRLKALARQDRVKHPVTFPAAPLAAAENGAPPEDVVRALREILEPYLR